MHRWFNTRKSINGIHHINKLSKHYHRITEKSITHSYDKNSQKTRHRGPLPQVDEEYLLNTAVLPNLWFHLVQLPVVSHSPKADGSGRTLGHDAYLHHSPDFISSHRHFVHRPEKKGEYSVIKFERQAIFA